MKETKNLVRVIMICMVLTAIIIGIVYYYHESQDKTVSDKGTLIAKPIEWSGLWQE